MSSYLAEASQELQEIVRDLNLTRPVLLLDSEKAKANIKKMSEKAKRNGVRFRPHFKTHQSAEIGEWFREQGVESIAVSSIDMAVYFADHGWNDILIAFSVNILEMEKLSHLAQKIKLGLLVESTESVNILSEKLGGSADVWIKIDAGCGRTGLNWENYETVYPLVRTIQGADNLNFRGLLAYSGNTHSAKSEEDVFRIFNENRVRANELRDRLSEDGIKDVEISQGDTQGCSLVEDFSGLDEIRPGNFVYYDLTAHSLFACKSDEIAVCMAVPVVAKHDDRKVIIVHGGAVHFSKDSLETDGKKIFGYASIIKSGKFGKILTDVELVSMSQEHGIIKASDEYFENVNIGDMALIFPVHSCLTANLMKSYTTLDGKHIEMGKIF